MSEEIIIDGIDISKCDYAITPKKQCPNKPMPYAKETSCIACKIHNTKLNFCKNNPNCYYKKFIREQNRRIELENYFIKLERENEQAVNQYNQVVKQNKNLQTDLTNLQNYIKEDLKPHTKIYIETLKDIKRIVKGLKQTKIPFCTIEETIREKIDGVIGNVESK